MLGRRYEIARLQSNFYRDQFRRLVWWLMAELFIMLLFVVLILYYVFFPATQSYYANTTTGRVLPLIGEMVRPA